jgi:RNA polymerase sigma factor (sigma-70 family)
MPPTDTELLRRFAEERDERAFTELVNRRIGLVYTAALRQLGGDAARAKDVAQQVFIDVARKARSLRDHPSLLGWLYTSTHHAAIDTVRREARRKRREQEAQDMDDLTRTDELATDWGRLRPVLDAAMHDLNERERRMVLLRFFDQQPFAAIATELGLSENAAQKAVDRALDKLRLLLERRGVPSTSAALGLVLTNQAVAAAPAGLGVTVAGVATASAGGGAITGAMTALIQLMSSSKIAGGAALLALMATLGLTIHEVYSDRAIEGASVAARAESAILATKVRKLNAEAEAVAKDVAALKRSLTALQTSTTAGGAATAARGGGGGGFGGSDDLAAPEAYAAGREFLAMHEEARRALELSQRRSFESSWGVRLEGAGASPEEKEAIYREFVRIWPWRLRVSGIRWGMGVGRSQSSQEIDPFIRELLGEERFEQYINYYTVEPLVNLLQALAGATQVSEPLTGEQAEAVRQILQQNSVRGKIPPWLRTDGPEWARVRPQIEQVLSREQMTTLDRVLASGATNSRGF